MPAQVPTWDEYLARTNEIAEVVSAIGQKVEGLEARVQALEAGAPPVEPPPVEPPPDTGDWFAVPAGWHEIARADPNKGLAGIIQLEGDADGVELVIPSGDGEPYFQFHTDEESQLRNGKDIRSELAFGDTFSGVPRERIYRRRIMLPADFRPPGEVEEVVTFQVRAPSAFQSESPAVGLRFRADTGTAWMTRKTPSSTDNSLRYGSFTYPVGRVFEEQVHVKWTENNDGFVVWTLDGATQGSYLGRAYAGQTTYHGGQGRTQTGIYHRGLKYRAYGIQIIEKD